MEDRSIRFGLDPYRGQELHIWQGTVITNLTGDNRLVISADCDLAENKSGGEFFYLDIVRSDSFIRSYALPDTVGERLKYLEATAHEVVRGRNAAFEKVASHVFSEWLLGSDRERRKRDLPGAHAAELDLLDALAIAAKSVLAGNSEPDLDAESANPKNHGVLVRCENPQQAKKTEQINKKLRELIQSRLQAARLDLFVLPQIPGIDGSGHYVPFRSIKSMSREVVCAQHADVIDDRTRFYPIAVCRPVLLQSLLQKFMTYFIRIGFTQQFKTEQEKVVREIVEKIQ